MSEPDGYGPGMLVPSEDADPRGSRAGSPRPYPTRKRGVHGEPALDRFAGGVT